MTYTLPASTEKAEYVQSKFSKIASRYDLFNDLITQGMHRYWKNFMVEKAALKAGDTALDICCGTGDITKRLRKAVGDSGVTLGLDFSSGMLQVAQGRENNAGAFFMQGDAMTLPVQDSSVNAITVGYGLRNVTDISKCLRGVYKALRPGGKFLSLDVGKVKSPLIKPFFQFYFFHVVPRIGKLLYQKEDMFDYLPHSSIDYPDQDKLSHMLLDSGFHNVKYYNFLFGGSTIHVATKAG